MDKATALLERVNWLRVAALSAGSVAAIVLGLPPVGLAGEAWRALKGLADGDITAQDIEDAQAAGKKASTAAGGLFEPEKGRYATEGDPAPAGPLRGNARRDGYHSGRVRRRPGPMPAADRHLHARGHAAVSLPRPHSIHHRRRRQDDPGVRACALQRRQPRRRTGHQLLRQADPGADPCASRSARRTCALTC